MGRPRTPTNVLNARGAFETHSDRRKAREGEAVGDGEIGNAPRTLSKAGKKAWRYLVGQCPEGVLTGADRAAMELVAGAYAEIWNKEKPITIPHRQTVFAMLGKFGLTPSERAGLIVDAPEDDDDDFE